MEERSLHQAYLLTGGNMGDRAEFLQKAQSKIEESCGDVIRSSSFYETDAWGLEEQGKFLNQALLVETKLTPEELLVHILQIEETIGRKRKEKYGPRIIDIDILFYDDNVLALPGLTIPHPQMQNRRFALEPLAEIAPLKLHPLLGKTVEELLLECPDNLNVYKIV